MIPANLQSLYFKRYDYKTLSLVWAAVFSGFFIFQISSKPGYIPSFIIIIQKKIKSCTDFIEPVAFIIKQH